MRKFLGLSAVLLGLTLTGLSCSSTHKTTTTETTVTSSAEEAAAVSTPVDQQTSTTTTTETKAEHPGVLSSTFHAIGDVIALPFIIIGGLFRIIFGG